MILMMFYRKVIPMPEINKDAARVECKILGFDDTEQFDCGQVNFPTKQSWTKFWGAIQKGALSIPDLKVEMLNVLCDDGSLPTEKLEGELDPNPTGQAHLDKRWVGNKLVDLNDPDKPKDIG